MRSSNVQSATGRTRPAACTSRAFNSTGSARCVRPDVVRMDGDRVTVRPLQAIGEAATTLRKARCSN